MTETQRESVPRNDESELDTALSFLRFARGCVLKKAAGLSDEQLREVLVPTGTTVLGLVAHLTAGERYWFGWTLGGAGADDDETDFDLDPSARPTAEVLQEYTDAIAESDAVITRLGDPDARTARTVDGVPMTMRWVLAHMTSETARHAGHADILREQLDGTTGR
jgi:uncharacterized damage-inducible protein DinB